VRGVIFRRALPLLAGVLLLAGCGSGSGGSSSTETATTAAAAATTAAEDTPATTGAEPSLSIETVDPTKFMRGSSVGFGEGPAPSFAPAVKKAAKNAGCRLRADPSAVGIHLLLSDIVPLHRDNPDYRKVPRPPTNGFHRPLWADWGFYQQPVPYAYEVHNLEHGAVIIHLGLNINRLAGTKVLRLWAASPPYLLIVPGLPADVSRRGATVTSWQRAMTCKTWNPRTLNAIRTYRDTYRGTGPERVPSLNTGTAAQDLPKPVLPNPSAG
jgi:Protein of unknown function (DUF3105)